METLTRLQPDEDMVYFSRLLVGGKPAQSADGRGVSHRVDARVDITFRPSNRRFSKVISRTPPIFPTPPASRICQAEQTPQNFWKPFTCRLPGTHVGKLFYCSRR